MCNFRVLFNFCLLSLATFGKCQFKTPGEIQYDYIGEKLISFVRAAARGKSRDAKESSKILERAVGYSREQRDARESSRYSGEKRYALESNGILKRAARYSRERPDARESGGMLERGRILERDVRYSREER